MKTWNTFYIFSFKSIPNHFFIQFFCYYHYKLVIRPLWAKYKLSLAPAIIPVIFQILTASPFLFPSHCFLYIEASLGKSGSHRRATILSGPPPPEAQAVQVPVPICSEEMTPQRQVCPWEMVICWSPVHSPTHSLPNSTTVYCVPALGKMLGNQMWIKQVRSLPTGFPAEWWSLKNHVIGQFHGRCSSSSPRPKGSVKKYPRKGSQECWPLTLPLVSGFLAHCFLKLDCPEFKS